MPHAVRLAGSLVLALLVASCATTPPAPMPGTDSAVLSRASRTEYRGIPLLVLRGTPREVGYQYGALLSSPLREVQAEFSSLLDSVLGKGLRRWFADGYLLEQARATLATLPAEYAEELQGIAAGSGQPYDRILALAMTPELLFDVNCSSFVTTDGGKFVHARNFDFYFPGNVVSKYPLVVRYEIEGRVPFVNVGFVGLFGSYTGSNDAGISATEDTAIFTRKPSGPRAPVGYTLRMVLEGSRSFSDARGVLSGVTTRGYLVTVSSLTDRTASVFELVGTSCREVPLAGERIRVTNRCLSVQGRMEDSLLLSDFDVNTAREAALDAGLAVPTEDPVARARTVLADRSFGGVALLPPMQSLLQDAVRTVKNYSTIQSCIIDPAARVVHVSWAPGFAASGGYARIALDDLSAEASFAPDGLLESPEYIATRDFVSAMHRELMMKAFSFTTEDYRRLYAKVLTADLPAFAKLEWTLAFAVRLGDWERAVSNARELAALMPGSYYGQFWTGFALLQEGRAGEARDALIAASVSPRISACARFIVFVYLAKALGETGDTAGQKRVRGQAKAILAAHHYSEGLAAKLGQYFPDPELPQAVNDLSRDGQ